MEQDLISVIIPVYNVQEYLDRCMDTVLNQTYQNLEIFLIDDGSTDQSGKLCDEYAQKDARIKVIHKENGGLSSARNAALEVCQGTYIGFVDSDDYIGYDMFERMYNKIKEHASDIIICGHFTQTGEKMSVDEPIFDEDQELTKEEALKMMIEDVNVRSYAWDKLYKASLFENVRYPDGRNYEDIATTYLVFDRAEKITRIPEYLYYYQIREGSISYHRTNEKWHKNVKDIVVSSIERYDYFCQKGQDTLAQMCLGQLLPYLFTLIKTGYNVKNVENVHYAQKWLESHMSDVIRCEYISEKDKQLIEVYTGSHLRYECFVKFRTTYKNYRHNMNKLKSYVRRNLLHVSKEEFHFELENGKNKRLIFFELPCFDNLGDHAIAYAQKKFLEDITNKNPEYQLYVVKGWSTQEAIVTLQKSIGPQDIILLQGGGNFGNLYDFADEARKNIFSAFKDNKIVLFPQTLYFTNDEAGKKAKVMRQQEVNACSNLKLCARDHLSYEMMKKCFQVPVFEVNDIVSYLDRSDCASTQRDGIMVCLRSDKESALSAEEKKQIIGMCRRKTRNILVSDTVTGQNISSTEREEKLQEKWKAFGRHRLVVTDRLHGMIFSLITKTPCIILGNNHHKVTETYKTFAECGYLYYAENIQAVQTILEEVYEKELPQEKYCITEKFELLEQIILK